MSNNWLYTRSKLFQLGQLKSLTSLSLFQSRNNTVSLDFGRSGSNIQDSLLKTNFTESSVSCTTPVHFSDDRNFFLQSVGGTCSKLHALNTGSKSEFLKFTQPLGVWNQDFIKSLSKIIEPVQCKDTLHVGTHPSKACRNANIYAFSSFDSFSSAQEQLKTDFSDCLHADSPKAAVKTNDKDWRSDCSGSPKGGKDADKDDARKGPTYEQLQAVKNYYIEIMPAFHKTGEQLTAGLHHQNIVFKNHLYKKPKETVGMGKYSFELSKMRIKATFLYPSYYLEIQSITVHEKDGYVRMHWRAYVMSNWKFVRSFMPILSGLLKGSGAKPQHDTIDAISTFHLDRDGKIIVHKVDRRIQVQNEVAATVTNLAKKTVQNLGLAPNNSSKGTPEGTL